MSETSIGDILNGTPEEPVIEQPEAETPPEAETTEDQARDERPRDEHGRFIPKGEKQPEEAQEAIPAPSAPPAPEESRMVPRDALQDERRKRQELEAQLREMQRQVQQIQQPPPVPQAVPDQWEDPEGHTRYLIQQAAASAREEALAEVRRERVLLSAEAAKQRHPDYVEKVDTFNQLAAQNPALIATMMQQPDPAEFAYNTAKQHLELSQYGSLEARDAALRAKWEAEALERLRAEVAPAQSTAPTTLAAERNVGSRSGPAWTGPASLSELLG